MGVASTTTPPRADVSAAAGRDRFGPLIERPDGADFPYYDGRPVALSAGQWIALVVAAAVGFLALITIPQPNNLVALIPRALFVGIPLATLFFVAREHWTALFRLVRPRDFALMLGFFLLNLAITTVLALVVRTLFGAAANPATDAVGRAGALDVVAFYAGTFIQLVGEEVFTILPFLAVLHFAHTRGKLSRKAAILLAWLLSALWFGAAHLPTYDWHVAQSLIVIGGARIALTLAFIRTKNLWVCAGAHILNDWVLFTFTLLARG